MAFKRGIEDKWLIVAIAIVVLFGAISMATSDPEESRAQSQQPDPASSFSGFDFEIIKDEQDSYKRSVEVLLPEQVEAEQLEAFAHHLHSENSGKAFIGYFIEGDRDYGYWATTNYDPDLKIRIIGTASELGTDRRTQSAKNDTGEINHVERNTAEISRAEYGDQWPFTVESGRLECRRGPAALFISGEKVYQLNGTAQQMGHARIDPIWRDNPDIPGTKINLGPFIQRALKMCD